MVQTAQQAVATQSDVLAHEGASGFNSIEKKRGSTYVLPDLHKNSSYFTKRQATGAGGLLSSEGKSLDFDPTTLNTIMVWLNTIAMLWVTMRRRDND